jgi:hypothetical protein
VTDISPDEIRSAIKSALLNHEWPGGYDRNGSHAAGEYCEYVEGLKSVFAEHHAAVYAEELASAVIESLSDLAICDPWALVKALHGGKGGKP